MLCYASRQASYILVCVRRIRFLGLRTFNNFCWNIFFLFSVYRLSLLFVRPYLQYTWTYSLASDRQVVIYKYIKYPLCGVEWSAMSEPSKFHFRNCSPQAQHISAFFMKNTCWRISTLQRCQRLQRSIHTAILFGWDMKTRAADFFAFFFFIKIFRAASFAAHTMYYMEHRITYAVRFLNKLHLMTLAAHCCPIHSHEQNILFMITLL